MSTTGRRSCRRVRGALTAMLLLTVLAAMLFAGSALAVGHTGAGKTGKPGTPTATAPAGTVTTPTPTFTWGKAKGAATYELRVYQAGALLLKKAGLRQRSWTVPLALPADVDLSWKVRAAGAGGVGGWSASLVFRIASPSSEKAFTAFSFQGLTPPVVGVINEAARSIALTVPEGTSRTALVATFSITGVAVAIAGVPQTSGVTANDFSNPVTYTVTARDGTTRAYVVTVTVAAPPAIGDPYQGGTVAYILQPGDPGYAAGETHGLIAATADQTLGITWVNYSATAWSETGATATGLGAGSANTTAIIAAQGVPSAAYAAGLARAFAGGGYRDWYLPSKDELNALYVSRGALGGFVSASYWSSSEIGSKHAWFQDFATGFQGNIDKDNHFAVRAVRSF